MNRLKGLILALGSIVVACISCQSSAPDSQSVAAKQEAPKNAPALSPKQVVAAFVDACQRVDDIAACLMVVGGNPSDLDKTWLAYRDKNRRGWIGVSKLKEAIDGDKATVDCEVAIGDRPNVPLLGGDERVSLRRIDGRWKIVPPAAKPKEIDKPALIGLLAYILTHPEMQRETTVNGR